MINGMTSRVVFYVSGIVIICMMLCTTLLIATNHASDIPDAFWMLPTPLLSFMLGQMAFKNPYAEGKPGDKSNDNKPVE